MILNGSAIDPSLITSPPNRVKSGKKRSTSNQPAFLTPNGSALSLVIDATPTPLVLDVNGVDVQASLDITLSGLTAAPSSQNTALVNDTEAADQHDTRLWGEPEHRKKITIDTVGTNITALIGKYAAFMLDNGSATEYFYAYVESATVLSQIRRGFFYDSSLNPKNRIVFSNNDTITLLKMGWVFVENDGTTADVTYNNPVWSFTSPSSPSTGDYWYDLANRVWKRYDGAAFQIISRTIVGVFANSTTACVAARCEDFFAKYEETNTLELAKFSTEIVKGEKPGQKVNVAGQELDFGKSLASWNITTDLAAASEMYDATEQASRMYYLYVMDTGDTVISDISPYHRSDLLGAYHPHNPWRCVGLAYNDGSSDLKVTSSVVQGRHEQVKVDSGNGHGSSGTGVNTRRYSVERRNESAALLYADSVGEGASFTVFWPTFLTVTMLDSRAGAGFDFGILANESVTDLGTDFITSTNATPANHVASFSPAAAGHYGIATGSWKGKIGDVLRPRDTGVGDATNVYNSYMSFSVALAS